MDPIEKLVEAVALLADLAKSQSKRIDELERIIKLNKEMCNHGKEKG